MTIFRLEGTSIIRESDGAFIPHDPMNADYRRYLDETSGIVKDKKPIPCVKPADHKSQIKSKAIPRRGLNPSRKGMQVK